MRLASYRLVIGGMHLYQGLPTCLIANTLFVDIINAEKEQGSVDS
jgi:hypothetical protein